METSWFYLERGDRRGPVDLPSLLKVLLAAPEPRKVKIWREGLPGWQDTDSVIEVSAKLPPTAPAAQAPHARASTAFTDVKHVSNLYRRLTLAFAANYLGSPFLLMLVALGNEMTSDAAALVILLALSGLIGTFVWILAAAYALMKCIGYRSPRVRVIAMLIPVVKLFVLLGIFQRTNAWYRRHGVEVGFFGPTKESLERLRRMEWA